MRKEKKFNEIERKKPIFSLNEIGCLIHRMIYENEKFVRTQKKADPLYLERT